MISEPAVRKTVEALDLDGCVRLAQDLIRVPSVTGDERAAQDLVALMLEEAGLEVDRFDADVSRLKAHPRFPGMEVPRTEAVLVAGILGQKGERSLILNGHVDVVPPGDRQAWHASPWSAHIQAGRLYGRGACDMKSGVAVAIAAAAALKKSGLPLRGRLMVQSVVGEEDGGIGSFAMADRGYRADAAYVLEPTRLRVIPAQAGALTFRLRIRGRAAHASVRYDGISAIEKYEVVEARLRQLEGALNQQRHPLFSHYPIPYALSIGRMRAGSWSASVPDQLECEGRLGVPVGMASAEARRQFAAALADAAQRDPWLADHPPQVEWYGGQFDAVEVDPELPAFAALRAAHLDIFGVAPELEGAPYGSDMRLLVHEAETPAVLYGPGDIRQAHATDEWIAVDEIVQAARVVTAAAARYLAA
ncbi:MAG TPA: ArgE/DapE family deacylase [Candidatus Dormibacteraeota bacterium]|nr:ArgE/DapE family deacylase [Candidatus Dormibacteraeota bacterium]